MASGTVIQADAIKNLEDNIGLLKKTEAFDNIRENNNLTNSQKLKVEISKSFYGSWGFIKKKTSQKALQIKNFLVLVISTVVIIIIVGLAYFSGK